jgi:Family of unknown function (DUF6521)
MNHAWSKRNPIVANLFNPAFCGELIRIVVYNYNKQKITTNFPFAFSFLVLPILLHKETREQIPKSVRTYLFVWVESNDFLFFDFSKRTKSMVNYTREALMFAMAYKKIDISNEGEIIAKREKVKLIAREDYEEYNEIIKKAEMLGKWLATTSDVKSIYSFFRITP